MASKKSVLDMIKAEHKENIQKSNETKTIVIEPSEQSHLYGSVLKVRYF